MPLSYLRRPLPVLTFAYICLLVLLHSWGWFRLEPAPRWPARLYQDGVRVEGKVDSPLTQNRIGRRFRLAADGAELWVTLSRRTPAVDWLRPGQRVALTGKLRRPRRPRLPGEFDERRFLEDQGVSFVFHASAVVPVDARIPAQRRLEAWAEAVHRSVHDALARIYDPTTACVLEGLMLGYKGPLDAGVNRAVQDAGVMHLLVPSGAKVAFLMLACLWAGRAAGLGLVARLVPAAVVGGFYTVVVGLEPPYLRAYLGAMAGFAAYALDRESGAFQALALSALVVLVVWPRALFLVGFQMSYLAALGLLVALPRWRLPARWPRAARACAELVLVSAVVQAMLWPLFAGTFGRGSLVGVLANVPLVPLSGLLMGWGFCVWGLGTWAGAAGLGWAVQGFVRLCEALAALPAAAVDLSPFSRLGTAAYYLSVFGVLLLPDWRRTLAFAAAGAVLLGAGGAPAWAGPPLLSVLVLERRGRWAALVREPGAPPCLVDGGLAPSSVRRAMKALGASVAAVCRTPVLLRIGDFQARLGSEGPPEFCILETPERCRSDRRFTARGDGAVLVESDGRAYEITVEKAFD